MSYSHSNNRDLSVERMLTSRGFNREAFLAVNDLIRARREAGRKAAAAPEARGSTRVDTPSAR